MWCGVVGPLPLPRRHDDRQRAARKPADVAAGGGACARFCHGRRYSIKDRSASIVKASCVAADWCEDLAGVWGRLAAGRHHDPHGVLGARERGGEATVLAHLPDTAAVTIDGQHEMRRVAGSDFFRWQGPLGTLSLHYRPCRRHGRGGTQERVDPYSFFPTLTSRDLTAFNGGFEARAWQFLGAPCMAGQGVGGARPFLSGAHAG